MRRRKRSFRREAAQIAQQSSARAKRSGRKEPRRRTGAERAGSRCGRSRSQSGDWRELRDASETALSARSERLGRNHAQVRGEAQEMDERRSPRSASPLPAKRRSPFRLLPARARRLSCPENRGISNKTVLPQSCHMYGDLISFAQKAERHRNGNRRKTA